MNNSPASPASDNSEPEVPEVPEVDTNDNGHDHEEFDTEEEPIGTLALLSVYLIVIVGLWVAVYVTLIERS